MISKIETAANFNDSVIYPYTHAYMHIEEHVLNMHAAWSLCKSFKAEMDDDDYDTLLLELLRCCVPRRENAKVDHFKAGIENDSGSSVSNTAEPFYPRVRATPGAFDFLMVEMEGSVLCPISRGTKRKEPVPEQQENDEAVVAVAGKRRKTRQARRRRPLRQPLQRLR